MKELLPFLKPYRKETFLAPLFKLFEALLELLVPLVVADIIDRGIAGGDAAYVRTRCLLLVGIAAVGLVCAITAQYFSARAAVGFTTQMKSSLFAHLMGLSHAEIDRLGTGALITRMTSDANQIQTGLNLTLRLALRSPFVVFGAMVMAFVVDAKAALTFVAVIALLFLVVILVSRLSVPLHAKVQAGLDQVTASTREDLAGVRVLRAFGMEDGEVRRFTEKSDALYGLQRAAGRVSAVTGPLTFVVLNLGVVWLLHTGGLRIDSGELTQGQMVALYNYMSQILVELVKLAGLIVSIARAIASAGRISAVFRVKSSIPTDGAENAAGNAAEEGTAPLDVVFDDVFFAYPDAGEDSLEGISFAAPAGSTVGIIGGTGSGKSTLAALVPRFYDTRSGAVRVGGRDVKDWDVSALRRSIGVVPQKAVLFAGTVRGNLLWGRKDASEEELWEALESAQAAEIIRGKEGGLDAPVEQGGRNFSGGQRQRLTIARALLRRPGILILDDSSSALDLQTDAALRRALRAFAGRTTTFIISQRTSSIRHADQILVLDDGRLVGCGTHEGLLETCALYREIHLSQNGEEAAHGA